MVEELKCPDCGEDREYMLTIRDEEVISCTRCDYSSCPECGSELNELIDYVFGCKTSDGFECPKCGWEVTW